jgi:hypothetical protein
MPRFLSKVCSAGYGLNPPAERVMLDLYFLSQAKWMKQKYQVMREMPMAL